MLLWLAASHPDRVGGLGFVNIGQTAFAAVPFAASCVLAGAAANRIFHEGVRLQTYQVLILTYVIVSIVIGLLPMLAFVRHQADILVATTIIESGVDIPNVNTIFIHEADKYGLADQIGSVEAGKRADLLVVDARDHLPNGDVYTTLVYSCRGSDVRTVLVDGKLVVEDGRLLTLDAEAVRQEAVAQRDALVHRAELV